MSVGLAVVAAALLVAACGGVGHSAPGKPQVSLSVLAPSDGATVGVRNIVVAGTVSPATATVMVGGQPATVVDGSYRRTLQMTEPTQTIAITGQANGYTDGSASTTVQYSPQAASRIAAFQASGLAAVTHTASQSPSSQHYTGSAAPATTKPTTRSTTSTVQPPPSTAALTATSASTTAPARATHRAAGHKATAVRHRATTQKTAAVTHRAAGQHKTTSVKHKTTSVKHKTTSVKHKTTAVKHKTTAVKHKTTAVKHRTTTHKKTAVRHKTTVKHKSSAKHTTTHKRTNNNHSHRHGAQHKTARHSHRSGHRRRHHSRFTAAQVHRAWMQGCESGINGQQFGAYCGCTYTHLRAAGTLGSPGQAAKLLGKLRDYGRTKNFNNLPRVLQHAVTSCASKLPDPLGGMPRITRLPAVSYTRAVFGSLRLGPAPYAAAAARVLEQAPVGPKSLTSSVLAAL
jgi:hypothetical protein